MKMKKLLSVIIAVCMIMQVLPVFAQEVPVPSAPAGGGGGYDINYIINDDFGDSTETPNEGEWTLEYPFDTTTMDAVYDESLGGYFLKYEATTTDGSKVGNGTTRLDDETHVLRTLPNGGITYEDGKNVVIETRYMQTSTTARSFLRANINTKAPYVIGWNLGVLFGIDSGKVRYSNGIAANTQGNIKSFAAPFDDGSYVNKFVNAKIVILGTTKTAEITISDDDGNTQTVTASLVQPENAQVETDALKTLAFNFMNSPNTIYVDYVRVYEKLDVEMWANDAYRYDEPVSVEFSEASPAFLEATDIYDADGNVVTIAKEISEDNKTVTFNADLTEGNVYTVKVDSSILGPQLFMTENEKTFKAMDKTYAVYDDFGDGDTEGWAQIIDETKPNHGAMGTEPIGDGNYALTYESFQSAIQNNNSDWQFEYIERDLKDIVFEDGKDVVIETRLKTTGNKNTFLKMNMYIPYNEAAYSDEWNLDIGTLLRTNGGKYGVVNGVSATKNYTDKYTPGLHYMAISYATQNVNRANEWVNAKITIHGTSKTASFVLTDDTGTLVDTFDNMSFDYEDATNWEEDILKTLAFRNRDIEKVSVDYLKVYEEVQVEVTEVEMSVNGAYKADAPIEVNFSEASPAFLEATDIYDADGNVVTVTKEISEDNKTVTFNATLTEGNVYTVKVDSTLLDPQLVMIKDEKTFKAMNMTYAVYDDFGDSIEAPTAGEWSLEYPFDTTTMNAVYDESLGGYFLKYEATTTDGSKVGNGTTRLDDETHVLRTLPNGGITYEDGKNVVIETRYMQTSTTARSFLRANINTKAPYVIGWNLGILFGIDSGKVRYSNGIAANTQGNIKSFAAPFDDGSYVNKFVTAKIVILGTTKTAEITISDDDGNTQTVTASLVQPENAQVDTDALKTLAFNFMNSPNTIYVDYVRVYESFDVEMWANDAYRYDEPVSVEFSKASPAFLDATDIYDADGNVVEATKEISEDNKTVTFNATLTEGNVYTVKVNSSALEPHMFMSKNEKTFKAMNKTYAIYDDFGDSAEAPKVEDWSLEYPFATTTMNAVYDESLGGYFLKYEATTTDGSKVGNGTTRLDDETHILRTLPNGGITYEDGKNVVIETRYMQTNASARSFLRANINTKVPYVIGWNLGILFGINTGKLNYSNGPTLAGNQGNIRNFDAPFNDGSYVNKFVTAKIVILGATKTAEITISDDDGNTQTVTASIAQPENAQVDTDALKTLAFNFMNSPNTIYVDYVRVYERFDIDGKIINQSGSSAMYNEPLKFTLASDKPVSAVSKGAIKIEGVETTQSYDPATQVITLTPETDLTVGNVYNVTVDKAVLANDGVTYRGTEAFSIQARDEYAKTGISDNFADDINGWDIGVSQSGYEAKTDVVDDEGARDGKALKIEFPARGTSAKNQYGSVTKKIDNGIEFNDDSNIIIETRVKMSDANGHFALRLNRPDTLDQFKNDNIWKTIYSLFENSGSSVIVTEGVYPDPSDEDTFWCPDTATLTETSGFDFANKWVTYKLTLNNAEKKIYTTITYTNEDGEEVTLVDNDAQGVMLAARWDIDAAYGKGAYDVRDRYYDALERLTFTSNNDCDIYVDYIDVKVVSTKFIGKAELMVDGKVAESITPGTTVKPTFTINPEDGVTEYTVISALYIDGALEDTHINPITVTEDGYVYTEADGWVIPSALEGKYEIKAFVWDTLGGMRPVSEVAKIQSTAND